jgi:hypothetical protein
MTNLSRMLPIWAALVAVLLAGMVHAIWTDRWGTGGADPLAAARLAAVPLIVGDWVGEPLEIDQRQLTRAEINHHLLRRYVNRRTGREVSVLLVSGRGGPIAVHTPEICFAGSGYELVARPVRYTLPGSSPAPEFWTATFRKGGPVAEHLRIYWAWNAAGTWQAPENARLALARFPTVYKLYVMRSTAGRPDEGTDADPTPEFLKVLLPAMQQGFASAS